MGLYFRVVWQLLTGASSYAVLNVLIDEFNKKRRRKEVLRIAEDTYAVIWKNGWRGQRLNAEEHRAWQETLGMFRRFIEIDNQVVELSRQLG